MGFTRAMISVADRSGETPKVFFKPPDRSDGALIVLGE